MSSSILILVFCFLLEVVLQLVWIVTDYRSLKEKIKWSLKPQTLLFSSVNLITGILLIITIIYLPLPRTLLDPLLIVIGLVVAVLGFIIASWAKLTMRKSWAPAEQPTIPNQENKLIISGPFRFSRNPIYLGVILLALGTCIALRSYLIFIVIIPIIKFYKASIVEENILEKKFGEPYLEYKNKVRRFI